MTQHNRDVHIQKAKRALQLAELGLDSRAICERLGISRHRLSKIKARAKNPRPEKRGTRPGKRKAEAAE